MLDALTFAEKNGTCLYTILSLTWV
jgi:hypothetical protein